MHLPPGSLATSLEGLVMGGWEKTRWQIFYVDVEEFVFFCSLKKYFRTFSWYPGI